MQHIFISYKNEDLDFAENVISRLEKEGFTTWADSKIGAGEEWRTSIDLAVKNALALVVIMTPEAKASEYVTYEWAFAWGVGIKVIPVMLRPTQLHPRLEALQYLDFTNAKSRPWDRLIEEVRAASNAPLTYSVSIPLNSPPFIRQAVASLDSANFDDRTGAIKTLEMARTPAAYAVLREALKHPLPDVRSAAADSLKGVNDPATVAALIEATKDPERDVRRAAADSLKGVNDPAAVAALIEATKDPERNVRRAAADSLKGVNDPAAVAALIEALKDPERNVRWAAADSLKGVNDPAAVAALIEALKDPTISVHDAAADSLKGINDPAAVPFLIEVLKHRDWHVRLGGCGHSGRHQRPCCCGSPD